MEPATENNVALLVLQLLQSKDKAKERRFLKEAIFKLLKAERYSTPAQVKGKLGAILRKRKNNEHYLSPQQEFIHLTLRNFESEDDPHGYKTLLKAYEAYLKKTS